MRCGNCTHPKDDHPNHLGAPTACGVAGCECPQFRQETSTEATARMRHEARVASPLDELVLIPVRFHGASDDLIEVEGDIPGADEYNGDLGRFDIAGLRVRVEYARAGTWDIAVGLIDEGVPVTARSIELSPGALHDGVSEHSMLLSMLVPRGAYVTCVGGVS